jgi:arginase family enzyme
MALEWTPYKGSSRPGASEGPEARRLARAAAVSAA